MHEGDNSRVERHRPHPDVTIGSASVGGGCGTFLVAIANIFFEDTRLYAILVYSAPAITLCFTYTFSMLQQEVNFRIKNYKALRTLTKIREMVNEIENDHNASDSHRMAAKAALEEAEQKIIKAGNNELDKLLEVLEASEKKSAA